MVCQPRFLRWCLFGGGVFPAEIPITGKQGNPMAQVGQFFGEAKRQSGEPAIEK